MWQPISKIKPFTEMYTKSRRRMAKLINMFRNMNVSVQYHIQLAPNAMPYISTVRNIPGASVNTGKRIGQVGHIWKYKRMIVLGFKYRLFWSVIYCSYHGLIWLYKFVIYITIIHIYLPSLRCVATTSALVYEVTDKEQTVNNKVMVLFARL